MTFDISIPWVVGIVCFIVPVVVGYAASRESKDGQFLITGTFIGIFLAIVGPLIASGVIESNAQEKITEAHLATMPEDWRGLHRLLKETELLSTKKDYVTDFLKDKTEPEISIDARDALCDIHGGWVFTRDQLMPHTIIDVKAAIAALPNPDE